MTVIDEAAWQIMRLGIMLQLVIEQSLWKDGGSIRRKARHIGDMEGLRHVLNSRPEELPWIIRDRIMMQGRIIVAVIVMVIVMAITASVTKGI